MNLYLPWVSSCCMNWEGVLRTHKVRNWNLEVTMERGKARRTWITNRNSLRPQEWSMSSCLNPSCADSYFQLMTDTETGKRGHTPTKGQLHAKNQIILICINCKKKVRSYLHITFVNFANNIFVPSTIIRSMQDSLPWLFPSPCSSSVKRHISHTVTFRLKGNILVCCHILAKFSHYFTCKQDKLRKLQRKKSRLTQNTSRASVWYRSQRFPVFL